MVLNYDFLSYIWSFSLSLNHIFRSKFLAEQVSEPNSQFFFLYISGPKLQDFLRNNLLFFPICACFFLPFPFQHVLCSFMELSSFPFTPPKKKKKKKKKPNLCFQVLLTSLFLSLSLSIVSPRLSRFEDSTHSETLIPFD